MKAGEVARVALECVTSKPFLDLDEGDEFLREIPLGRQHIGHRLTLMTRIVRRTLSLSMFELEARRF